MDGMSTGLVRDAIAELLGRERGVSKVAVTGDFSITKKHAMSSRYDVIRLRCSCSTSFKESVVF